MDWKDREGSGNIEDARGRTGGGGGFGGGGGGMFGLLTLIGRTFGIKGILVALVAGFFLYKCGFLGQLGLSGDPGGGKSEYVQTPEDQERYEFVSRVLKGTEEVWRAEFARQGMQYVEPKLVVFRSNVSTRCGTGSAAMGPFYCPADQQIYIDLSFFDELARTFNSPGDFAQAYVIAHEVGHHVQKLLGDSDKVSAMRNRPDYNQYSVRLELQADFYAGMWARQSMEYFNLDKSDIEEAMRAANAIGDDAIQKKQQGKIVPHSFTHGTSEQRMRWFKDGLDSGKMEDGDTFSMPYQNL
ncbi:MAG: metalloprotease [Verrucomicrobiaceae bacterium]|nr:MAG: metalloprotease [Verrucomicrobiaceae bacterium]